MLNHKIVNKKIPPTDSTATKMASDYTNKASNSRILKK